MIQKFGLCNSEVNINQS